MPIPIAGRGALALSAVLLVASSVAAQPAPSSQPPAARLESLVADLGMHDISTVARTPDGRIYFTRLDGVYGYDPVRREPFLVHAGASVDVAVSARGDRLAFAHGEPIAVWTVPLDPRTGRAVGAARRLGLHGGRAPAISPDGRFVAYSALPLSQTQAMPRIVVVPAAGGPERVVVSEPGFAQPVRWSHDGRWIYWWHGQSTPSGRVHTIRRVRREGGGVEVLAPAEQLVGLSPDGAHVAYAVTRPRLSLDVEKTVVIADTGGRELGRIVLPRDAIPEDWGPGPRQLLVRRVRSTSGIHMVDLHGRVRELTPVTGNDEWPSLSPDGRQLRLQTAGDRPQLVVVDLAMGRRRVLHVGPEAGAFQWIAADRVLFFPQNRSEVELVQLGDGPGGARTHRLPGCTARLPVFATNEGRRVLCTVRRGTMIELHALSPDQGRDTLLRTIPYSDPERPMLALAGEELLVLAARGNVRTFPLAGGPSRTLLGVGQDETLCGMGVSSDGDWLAVLVSVGQGASRQPARLDLRVVSIRGGAARTIPLPTAGACPTFGPWDPASRYVTLYAGNGATEVWIAPLSGEPPYLLTAAERFGIDMLSLAPDGSGLLYAASREGASLWIADLAPVLAPRGAVPP